MVISTRMRMRKQDPTVEALGTRTVLIPWAVQPGPKDRWIEIAGRAIEPDGNGDFLRRIGDSEVELDAFDAVHTFAVVHRVLMLYERCLRRLGAIDSWGWHWGTRPLGIKHRAGTRRAARYRSGSPGALEFYSFESLRVAGTVHTCQSFDAVAHEAGHAILDTLRPAYLASSDVDALALHEAFGDLTAIFALLDQLDVCEAVVAESKADLLEAGFLSAIAEQFGLAHSGLHFGIRNAVNEATLDQAGLTSVYRRSNVLTGAVYEYLSLRYASSLDLRNADPALTLHRVAAETLDRLMAAILQLPERRPGFRHLAIAWIGAEDEAWRPQLREVLERRRLPYEDTERFAAEAGEPDLSGTCATFEAAAGRD